MNFPGEVNERQVPLEGESGERWLWQPQNRVYIV